MSSQQLRVRYHPIHAASSRIYIPYRDGHSMSFDDLHTGPNATQNPTDGSTFWQMEKEIF